MCVMCVQNLQHWGNRIDEMTFCINCCDACIRLENLVLRYSLPIYNIETSNYLSYVQYPHLLTIQQSFKVTMMLKKETYN